MHHNLRGSSRGLRLAIQALFFPVVHSTTYYFKYVKGAVFG